MVARCLSSVGLPLHPQRAHIHECISLPRSNHMSSVAVLCTRSLIPTFPLHCIPQQLNRITTHRAARTTSISVVPSSSGLSSLSSLSMGTQRFVQGLRLPYYRNN